MAVNQDHPDYPAYHAKYRALWEDYYKLEKKETEKYPDWRGLDHPANEVLCPAYREVCRKAKKLQEEYSYLFQKNV